MGEVIFKQWAVGSFQCNCRLWACSRTGEALVVDPGDEGERLIRELSAVTLPSGVPLQIKYLLHTHGHLDHVGATRDVRESSVGRSARIALHRADEPLYQSLVGQGKFFGFQYREPLGVETYLEDGAELQVGDLKLSIVHTPGHSPGSVCVRLHEDSALGVRESLVTGDTLFKRNVGRTDLWGGDDAQLSRSIRQRIMTLDDDTLVCPGHGPDSTIGLERRENPYLK